MDPKCSQLLPSVCTILADPTHPISDDTCLEKLLDWFKTLTEAGSTLLLLEENPCLTELIRAVLRQEKPHPNILSFVLRLTGIFAASESSFQHLQQGEVVLSAFGESGPLGGALWEDTSVRSGWVQGARSLLRHQGALQLLCDSGALEAIFTLQGDRSLFVASGANRLLSHMLILSVQSNPLPPLTTKDCDWPTCARRIIAHVETFLASHSAVHVKRSLQVLTTLFEQSRDTWTEVLWSRVAEAIETLLREGAAQTEHSLVDLFLSLARSSFSRPESSFWKVIAVALRCFGPAHAGPLALGLLKLEACPQAAKTQSLHILLQPMDCIFRAASQSTEVSGLLDAPSPLASSVESLLSSRSSCISLLCQTLTHLEEIQRLGCWSADVPHKPLLCSVVTVLQFCVGLAVPVSSLGVTMGKILIGCFRVQRAALSLLGALSQWETSGHDAASGQVSNLLLVYLKSPDTSPTVLKKTFQAMLRWFLSGSDASSSTEDFQWHRQFLGDVLPVVQKRLCSPSWEARDSALEFLTLMAKQLRGQEWFWQVLSSSETLALAEGLLDDPESYVRASAVKASGQFSLMPSVGSRTAGWDHNGSEKEARLLEILSTDSEGFPRRAVIGIFTDWLREGHPSVLADPEAFFSRVIQVVNGDLDWEVKLSGLELAEVFVAQTLGRHGAAEQLPAVDSSPASQPASLPELLQTFCRVKLFDFLFGALGDCDRPVALKACKILAAVKSEICTESSPQEGPRSGLDSGCQLEETLRRVASGLAVSPGGASAGTAPQDPKYLLLILESIDLEGLQSSLDRSSDYLESSPQSLLQDILSAGGSAEENEADCY